MKGKYKKERFKWAMATIVINGKRNDINQSELLHEIVSKGDLRVQEEQ